MSGFYELEVEVTSVKEEEREEILKKLAREGVDVEVKELGAAKESGSRTFYVIGAMSLAGTDTPMEAHARFKKALDGKQVASRWRCLDDLHWDEELGPEG
jgi:hypothetical protein